MATVEIKSVDGKKVGSVELSDAIFGSDINEHLIWEAVKWQMAKKRRGTHKTKTRAEVNFTNIKPFKQKGTGRARAGTRRSPIWVGGGTTFGPQPRDYEYPMPKKARRRALASALSARLNESKLTVVDNFTIADGKTKNVAKALGALGAERGALIVDSAENTELSRGAKNLPYAKWLAPEGLNVYDILNHEHLLLSADAVKQIESAFSSESEGAA